ncbi:uncharacterized protein LOC144127244 [Amblyomma americanum]
MTRQGIARVGRPAAGSAWSAGILFVSVGGDARVSGAVQDLVFLLREHVASVVLVFKILQLHYDDPHKVRFEDRRRRHLNRRRDSHDEALVGRARSQSRASFPGCFWRADAVLICRGPIPRGETPGHRPQCAFVPLQWQVQGKSGHDNSATTICPLGSLSAATSFPESVQRAGLGG